MGPTIILDKSAIQSFSESELNTLTKYYTLNVTYNLYHEILADLAKKHKNKDYKTQVIYLANKLNPNNFKINMHYRILLINELLGVPAPFGYRTVVPGGEIIHRPDGKIGTFIKQTSEEDAIERWKEGKFTEEELVKAQLERDKLSGINLEEYRSSFSRLKSKINPPITEENLGMFMPSMQNITNKKFSPLEKFDYIENLMDLFKTPLDVQNQIKERWYSQTDYDLFSFAPYLMYFDNVFNTFNIGLTYGIFGTRTTNLIDTEYLFYLPFCFVFCTGDSFQYRLAQYIKPDKVNILKSVDLKNDLINLVNNDHKLGPPEGSLTAKIYQDYKSLEKTMPSDDLDFLTLERYVSPYSPCPCGSGKKFKDCHLEKVRKVTHNPNII